MKQCTTCGRSKPVEEFHARLASPDGLSYKCKGCAKAYRHANKDAYKRVRRAYYDKNMELEKARSLSYYHQNADHCIERMRAYKLANPDKIKRYVINYYPRFIANTAKRRAALALRTPKWLTTAQLEEIHEMYLSAHLLKVIYGTSFHVDHVVPLRGKNVSGLHVPWNLQILSAFDNMSKGCRHEP